MNTQISSKLAALAMALMINSLMVAGIAYLFNAQLHEPQTLVAMAAL
jgi:hypothetical protein